MRLIGRPDLARLARSGESYLRGAALALAAELEAALWQSPAETRDAFPLAEFADDCLTVDLGDHHCAMVTINYEKGVAVVTYAGLSEQRPAAGKLRRGVNA